MHADEEAEDASAAELRAKLLLRWRWALHNELIAYSERLEKQRTASPPSEEEPSNTDAELEGPGEASGDFLYVQDHHTADVGEVDFQQIITANQYYFACHADPIEGYCNSTETHGLGEQHLQGLSHGKGKPSRHRPRGSTRRRRKEQQKSELEARGLLIVLRYSIWPQVPRDGIFLGGWLSPKEGAGEDGECPQVGCVSRS
jgi:hypothetical protein